MAERVPPKKGSRIIVSSLGQICMKYSHRRNNYRFYQLESNLPISVHYSYFALPFTDQNSSSDDDADKSNQKRRRHSQDHEEMRAFWSEGFATLPESLTRVARTEPLRNQQHIKMVDMIHQGKANLLAARAELDLLKHQMKQLNDENNRLRAQKLEYQLKSDILERRIRSSSDENEQTPKSKPRRSDAEDDCNVGASTSKDTRIKQEYPIPEGFDRNESIFDKMQDNTFHRDDPAIIASQRETASKPAPRPLMAIKITPPKQGTKRPRDVPDEPRKDDNAGDQQGLGNFWNLTGKGPFVLHTHQRPRMENVGGNVIGRGGIVGVSQGIERIGRGTTYGRGYGHAGPSGYGYVGTGNTGFVRAGLGHGRGMLDRSPLMGAGAIGRGIGFKISPPRPRLPMPVPIRTPSIFDMATTTAPATSTTMAASGSSSSAVAGSSSSGSTTENKPKRTRAPITKKKESPKPAGLERDNDGAGSESDQSVLRIDLSEHEKAFFDDEDAEDVVLEDYEDAY